MTALTRAGLVATALTLAAPAAAKQTSGPDLTRQQRAALQAVVAAVDRASGAALTPRVDWPVHLLRTSDGFHYIAFSILAPPGISTTRPVALYVRLTRLSGPGLVQRSAVAEWLAGRRSTPLPPRRGIAFGEMPTYGSRSIASRGEPSPTQSLALLEMERERARERQERRDRERKAELEGEALRAANPLLPFEDFDLAAVAVADASGALALQRSVTAGPGDYELTVGWTDPAAKDPAAGVTVVKRTLQLPIASTTSFDLSSVIVADTVGIRDTLFTPEQQTAHPYSIGPTDIVPARDHVLSSDENLALVFQVINARAGVAGKPDVAVGFRLLRVTPSGQETVGMLNPQIYDQTTLPADFDIAKGHPMFAAVQVPLRSFKRGEYRMQILADDRVAGVSTTSDAAFTVVGTPAALLRDAPPLAAPFRREVLFAPAIFEALLGALRPVSPSPALATALQLASQRRFIDLIRDEPVPAHEQGIRTMLRALAMYAMSETPVAITLTMRQAAQSSAPPAAVHLLTGVLRALEGADGEAASAWEAAAAAGIGQSALASVLIDAHLRAGHAARAVEVGVAALAAARGDSGLTRRLAAAYVGASRPGEAVALLDEQLRQQPGDLDAQWLMINALFAGFVRGEGAGSDRAGRERLVALTNAYSAAGGRHSALAAEWVNALK